MYCQRKWCDEGGTHRTDVLARWNCQHGEEKGVISLQVPQEMDPDVYVFLIDNFVNTAKLDAVIATGARVILFFAEYHDANNTMTSELKAVADYRENVQSRCTCLDYKDGHGFELKLSEVLNKVDKN